MREINPSFYSSRAWIKCKNEYLKSVNHLCEVCLAKGIYTPAEIVHHKIHLTKETFGDPEIMFCYDNLQAVCKSCHNELHGKKKSQRRWQFVDGELITREL